MGQRLIIAAEQIIAALNRAFHWWFRQIGRQDTLRGKAIVACVGLMVICVACSIPISLVNGPNQRRPAVAAVPTARPTEIVVATAPTPSPTSAPEPTEKPTATRVAPTATSLPTEIPSPTPLPTKRPTVTPKPKPTAKPTIVPRQIVAPAASKYYTGGRDRYNCGDFATYAEAYAAFKANLPGDPNRLDRDNDGIPCESLPGAP